MTAKYPALLRGCMFLEGLHVLAVFWLGIYRLDMNRLFRTVYYAPSRYPAGEDPGKRVVNLRYLLIRSIQLPMEFCFCLKAL